MHSHSRVQAGDLSQLERAVRSATKAGGMRHHHQQVNTTRSMATSRSNTARSTGASTYRSTTSSHGSGKFATQHGVEHAQQRRERNGDGLQETSGSRPRPSTAGSMTSRSRQKQQQHTQYPSGRRSLISSRAGGSKDDGSVGIPSNIKNEWLILETYQQLMADEKQAAANRQAQSGAPADQGLPI